MELRDIDILTKDTLIDHLGIKITSINESEIEATMPVNEKTIQPFRLLHGGASIALAESIASLGSYLLCNENQKCFGIQVSANHTASAQYGDTVQAKASLIHKGQSTHVWNVDIFSQSTNKLVSTIRVTNSIIVTK